MIDLILDYLKIGPRLKKARIDKKMTQAQLAEEADLSNNYISDIERGAAIPSLETFVMLCNVLDVTADMMLTDSVYRSSEYLKENISVKLARCSKRNMRIIERFIGLLLEENP